MDIAIFAILIVLGIILVLNLLIAGFLVNTFEKLAALSSATKAETEELKQELLVRLPPRPYGVGKNPELTQGPNDPRINNLVS